MTFTIHTGDCRTVLASLPESSVDTVITDPPYGLAFMGNEWDQQVPGPDYWRAVLRVAKPGAFLLAFGGTRTWHRLAVAIEDAGWEVRDCCMWLYGSGFPKSLAIDKAIDSAAGAAREVVGERKARPSSARTLDPSSAMVRAGVITDTKPATANAKPWHGWGTALKPAWEPIIVAMRRLDGTFADNAQRHGVAGLAIDAGRVGEGGQLKWEKPRDMGFHGGSDAGPCPATQNKLGRWPSNVLLDEEAAAALDEQSGTLTSGLMHAGQHREGIGYNGAMGETVRNDTHGDTGGASRFFYVAKAARSERGAGNDHPTVKPVDLMRYLARLTKTPTGGVVLDPFCGSGSTGVGAVIEERDFIGIELDPHHAETARRRIATADPIGKQDQLLDLVGGAP